jgi:phosphoglycolate phosphatase-like HAD superfamily hydrolase
MQPQVLLFDIDGTLLKAKGAGRRALNRAFEYCLGAPGAIDHVDLQGMTDPLIVKAGLSHVGEPEDAQTIAKLLSQYLLYLEEELSDETSTVILPGVVELLTWLSVSTAPIAIGLGTGNIEAGAKAKLGRVGLNSYFAFGGYGSDHELRSEVLRIGAERGARLLGRSLQQCRTLVIGDTFRDIDAARAIGAECLAVATGGCNADELRQHGATLTTRTLAEAAVYRFFGPIDAPHPVVFYAE